MIQKKLWDLATNIKFLNENVKYVYNNILLYTVCYKIEYDINKFNQIK